MANSIPVEDALCDVQKYLAGRQLGEDSESVFQRYKGALGSFFSGAATKKDLDASLQSVFDEDHRLCRPPPLCTAHAHFAQCICTTL